MGGLRGQDQGWESALETEKKAWKARKDVRPYPVFPAFLMAPHICKSLQLGGSSQKSIWNSRNRVNLSARPLNTHVRSPILTNPSGLGGEKGMGRRSTPPIPGTGVLTLMQSSAPVKSLLPRLSSKHRPPPGLSPSSLIGDLCFTGIYTQPAALGLCPLREPRVSPTVLSPELEPSLS